MLRTERVRKWSQKQYQHRNDSYIQSGRIYGDGHLIRTTFSDNESCEMSSRKYPSTGINVKVFAGKGVRRRKGDVYMRKLCILLKRYERYEEREGE